jgi:hypothetical protein
MTGGLSLIARFVLPPMKARFAMSSASRNRCQPIGLSKRKGSEAWRKARQGSVAAGMRDSAAIMVLGKNKAVLLRFFRTEEMLGKREDNIS